MLPLRITIHLDEDVLSVACRLALRSNFETIMPIRKMIGLEHISTLGTTAPISSLKLLADAVGYDLSNLLNLTLMVRNENVWIGDCLLSESSHSPSLVHLGRICPICLAEDIEREGNVVACRPYRRLAWRLKLLKTCFHHGTLLIANCPKCTKKLSRDSLNVRFCSCGFDLSSAVPILFDETKLTSGRYLYSRVFMNNDNVKHWLLDLLPPVQAELALAQFGAAAAWRTKRKNISQLSSLERISAVSEGFNALASSQDLNRFLDQLADVGKAQRVGPCSIYGTLYEWLYKSVTKSFEPLKEIITEHYRDTQKVTKSMHIFHRRVHPKKLMSAEAAARECGCPFQTFHSVREAVEQKTLALTQKSNQVCVELVSTVKQFLIKNISSIEAAKQLNLSESIKSSFDGSPLFAIPSQRRFSRRYIDRERFIKLCSICDERRERFVEKPFGYADIGRAAGRYQVSIPVISHHIIEGNIRSIGLIAGKIGLAAVLVSLEDVKAIRRAIRKAYNKSSV